MATATRAAEKIQQETPKRGFIRRRWKLLVLGTILILVALVFFAPVIIAKTSLRHQVVKMLVPEFEGEVTIRSASLGWFSSVELNDVSIKDSAGKTLLEVSRIASEKSLLNLAANQTELGRFLIESPHLHFEARPDGSNLEDALAPLFAGPSSGTAVAVSVALKGGRAIVHDVDTGNQWNVTQLNATFDYPADVTQKVKAEASCVINHSMQQTGKIAGEWSWLPEKDSGRGQCVIRTENFPVAVAAPILRRFLDQVNCDGVLSADCRYEWKGDGSWHKIQLASLDGHQLKLHAPALTGSDELRLDRVKSSGNIEVRDGRLHADQWEIQSEVARLTANGSVAFDRININTWMSALTEEDYRIDGEIDFAQLARMLPQTLRLKEGTEIQSGKIALTVFSRAEGDLRRCVATLDVSNLSGEVAGKPVTWQKPIQMTMVASNSDDGPTVDSLKCESSFLKLTGSGRARFGKMEANADLEKLAAELGQFIDLTGYRLSGNAEALIAWSTDEKDELRANGTARIRDLDVKFPGGRPLRESDLLASVSASGEWDSTGLHQIQIATAKIESGSDQLTANLTEPIANWPAGLPLKFDCQIVGQLTTWLPRLQTFLPAVEINGKGEITFDAALTVHEEGLDVSTAAVSLKALELVTEALHIKEPEVQINLAGSVDVDRGRCKLHPVTVACTSMAFRAEDVEIVDRPEGVRIAGNVAYQADLGRLSNWWEDPRSPSSEKFFGKAMGNVQLSHGSGSTNLTTSTKFENLILASRSTSHQPGVASASSGQPVWQTVWEEKQLSLDGKLSFDHMPQRIHLQDLALESKTLKVTASGSVEKIASSCDADLRGTVAYDWEKLSPVMRPLLGDEIRIRGKDQRAFTVRGPLRPKPIAGTDGTTRTPFVSPALTAQTGLSWSVIEAYGVQASAGELNARLDSGIVRIEPLDIPLSEGRLRATPQVNLTTTTPMLQLGKGRLLEQVRISPQMCQSWLKYVAPWLADATRAEGTFSLDVDHANLPLTDPLAGKAKSMMLVHNGRIGPGPFGQQIEQVARQIRALAKGRPLDLATRTSSGWLTLPDQQVPVELREGRVFHQGLTFIAAKDVIVRTTGSVGADESLDLIAEVPIRNEWVTNQRVLAGLGGKAVKIPIRGTLTKPKVDRSVMKDLSRQLLRGNAEKFLEDRLKRGLDNLFRPKN